MKLGKWNPKIMEEYPTNVIKKNHDPNGDISACENAIISTSNA